jgi:hypothetical protein
MMKALLISSENVAVRVVDGNVVEDEKTLLERLGYTRICGGRGVAPASVR